MIEESILEEEIHLTDYIHVLLQRRKALFLTFCLIAGSAILYAFLATPIYEASASLFLADDKSKAGIFGELMMGEVTPIDSEIQIAKSRTIAEETVRRTHLHWQVSDKSAGLSFKLAEFSLVGAKAAGTGNQPGPRYTIKLSAPEQYQVLDREGKLLGGGASGVLFHGGGVSLLLQDLHGQAGDNCVIELLPFNATVQALMKSINVTEQKPKTNVLSISYQNPDPELASIVVNSLVQVYLEKKISFNNEEASKTLDFIDQQFGGIQKELDNSEKLLQEYKSTSGVVNLDGEAQSLLGKMTAAETQRAEAVLQKKQAEFALGAIRAAAAEGRVYSPAVLGNDPVVAGMAAKLTELQVQKSALVSEYTGAHPAVVNVSEQIKELQNKLALTFETNLRNNEKIETSLNQLVATYESDLHRLPIAERDLAGLMRYVRVNSDVYTLLLQKREEASIAKASTISKLRILDPAIVPDLPVKPKKAKSILLGLVAGLMAGVFFAFFLEYLDDTIKDGDTAKNKLGVPLLGTVPFISSQSNDKKRKRFSREKEEVVDDVGLIKDTLITHLAPKSPAAEAFRNLRTSIHFSMVLKKAKVIMLSSSFQGEGKSTISANLAISLAQSGAKVLLVDCDMRRPSQHRVFGHSKSPGLSDIIAGDQSIETVAHKLSIDGLELITSGPLPPNPAELLGSDKMRDLVASAAMLYDVVILDSPPVLAVTDARLLTVFSDMMILVLEAGRVPRKALEQVKELLGSTINSFIVNEKSKEHFERYYGYYRYYSSRYGGYSRYYHYGYYSDEEGKKANQSWWKKYWTRKG